MLCSRMLRTFFARTLPDCVQATPACFASERAGWVQAVLPKQARALLCVHELQLSVLGHLQACKRSFLSACAGCWGAKQGPAAARVRARAVSELSMPRAFGTTEPYWELPISCARRLDAHQSAAG